MDFVFHLPLVSHLLNFEKNFEVKPHLEWIYRNWTITIWLSCLYVAFLVIGSHYMKNRKPFDLRLPLGLWSLFLSIFSFFGSMRLVPELFDTLSSRGFVHSFCEGDYKTDKRINLWMILFMWSKAIEFIDTVFIVLRKQKLIFLHWYHHIITLIYCFFMMGYGLHGPYRWFASMNFAIHTVMYGYYAVKALRLFPVPSIVNKVITTTQILQMIMGFVINVMLMGMRLSNKKCDLPLDSNVFGLVVYSSFLILFVNFFLQTYRCKPPKEEGFKKTICDNNNETKFQKSE